MKETGERGMRSAGGSGVEEVMGANMEEDEDKDVGNVKTWDDDW